MKLKLNTSSALAYRGLQGIVWAAFVRIVIMHFGGSSYGLLAVMLSIVTWLQLFDLGFVSYLRTTLPQMRAQGQSPQALKALVYACVLKASSYFAFLSSAVVLVKLSWPSALTWVETLLHFDRSLTMVGMIGYILLILSYGLLLIISQFLMAYFSATYDQYRFFGLAMLGLCLQLISAYALSRLRADLFYVFAAFLLASLLPQLAVLARILSRNHLPKASVHLNRMISTQYFLCQLGGMFCYNIDVILVSGLFDLRSAAVYGTLKNMIQLMISAHAMIIQQTWPGLSRAFEQGNAIEFRRIIKRNVLITAIFAVTVLLAFSALVPWVFFIWTSGKLGPISYWLSFSFGVFGVLFVFGSFYGTVVMTTAKLNLLVPLAWLGALASIAVAFIFHRYCGLYAVVAGLSLAAAIGCVGCYVITRALVQGLMIRQTSLRSIQPISN